ncbi:hypothetical protein ABPG72_013892 [Tetrahymena utriculariae]
MKIENQFKLFDLVKFNELKSSLPEAKLSYCQQHNKRISIVSVYNSENKSLQLRLCCQECDFDAKKSYNLKKYLSKALDESVQANKLQIEDKQIIQKAEQLQSQLTKTLIDIDEAINNLIQLKQKAQNLASITEKKIQLASAPLKNTIQNIEYIINEKFNSQELSSRISLLNERFNFDIRSQTISAKQVCEFLNIQELRSLFETCRNQIGLINSLSSKSITYSSKLLKENNTKSCFSTFQSLENLTTDSMSSSCEAANSFEPVKQIDEIWRWGEQESQQHCVEKSLVVGCLKEFNLKRQYLENHIPSQKLLCHKCSIIYEKIKESIKSSAQINQINQ